MFTYLKKKFKKHKARTIFKEYPYKITEYELPEFGKVSFARWENPLEARKDISQGQVDFYKKILKKGDFIIDIGAHIGDSTIPMALAVGKEGTVLGFDPNPFIYKILEKNATLNKELTNIIPLRLAITTHNGDFFYNSSEASYNNGGIAETKENTHGKFGLEEKVKGVKLEEFLNENYPDLISKLSLIKIDTEGYDTEILKSILPFVKKHKPNLIFECFVKLNKTERNILFDLVADLGYDLYFVEAFDINTKRQKIMRENMSDWKTFDILATPKN
ncbi:FkbM family methyltransferase [Emticicia sp. BO119]|uniref:FkbM family methyltransferase n=1 Tax=Emticicia sp. BO119 TaxID=2757768 RepID=UPI0015EFF3FE|nr:FkbM family methyltransferase [Emticicia sp. BO119]MBA4850113.1 FkbM family methyltransferase [Emticicia sp. BO119]